jgi:hypothetical protein
MKTRKIIAIIVTSIASLMVIFSGVVKLIGPKTVTDKLTDVGVGNYIIWLGLMEVVFTLIFIYPKTMKIGLLLLSCYFGGAIATELSHSGPAANAVLPLVLIWVAAYLRDRSAFLPGSTI